MANFKRSDRLRELFLQQVSELLQNLKDPGISGFVTVTDLTLAADMKTARVYYSILGSDEDRESTARALERSAGFIRSALRGRLDLKFIPKLEFKYDPTPERAHRIETLFNQLESERGAPVQESSPETSPEALKSVASGKKTSRSGKQRPRR